MSFEDYTSGMIQVMNGLEFLYSNLTRDAYSQLSSAEIPVAVISYNIFMYGLILSVLAFVIATIFFPGSPPSQTFQLSNVISTGTRHGFV